MLQVAASGNRPREARRPVAWFQPCDATVEVRRVPDRVKGRYGTMLTLSGQDALAPESLPGPRLVVASLFAATS
jgi:hypothetical protein